MRTLPVVLLCLAGVALGWGKKSVAAPPPAPILPAEFYAEAVGTGMIVLFGTGTVSAAVYLGAQAGLWQIAVRHRLLRACVCNSDAWGRL